jgi:glutathione peroxidase
MPCSSCSVRTALMATLAALALLGSVGMIGEPAVAQPATVKGDNPVSPNVLSHKFELIDGTPTSLDAYKGKVVLIVNTASRCGLTPQYEALEKLYRAHQKDGLVIIGFPANNFMGQEPGTNEEILEFCTGEYEVTFPMAAKVSVKGEDAHPLFKQLAAQPAPLGGEPAWNFTKFVVDRQGDVVARFEPRTKPDDEKVVETLRGLLSPG